MIFPFSTIFSDFYVRLSKNARYLPLTFPSGSAEGADPVSQLLPPHTRQGLWPCHPLLRRGFFQAIYASRSESFLTIREVMRNSTATKAKKPHWALVVSEVAIKS